MKCTENSVGFGASHRTAPVYLPEIMGVVGTCAVVALSCQHHTAEAASTASHPSQAADDLTVRNCTKS